MSSITRIAAFLAVMVLAACSDRSLEEDEPLPAPQPDAANVDAATEGGDAADSADKVLADMCGFGELHAAVAFMAPVPRGEGHLAYSASIKYPSMANKTDVVPGLNPFPGCLAAFAKDDALDCDFGAAFQGTLVTFNVGLNDGSYTDPAGHYFSGNGSGKVLTLGTYAACVGGKLVGSCKENKCEGALVQDEYTGNLVFTVPQS